MEFKVSKANTHFEDFKKASLKAKLEKKRMIALLGALNPRYKVINITLDDVGIISIQVERMNGSIGWFTLNRGKIEDCIELWKSV